jgi:hypothetical protein
VTAHGTRNGRPNGGPPRLVYSRLKDQASWDAAGKNAIRCSRDRTAKKRRYADILRCIRTTK